MGSMSKEKAIVSLLKHCAELGLKIGDLVGRLNPCKPLTVLVLHIDETLRLLNASLPFGLYEVEADVPADGE